MIKIFSYQISDYLGSYALRSNRQRALEFEPTLRTICRSEQLRSTLERRSTRFYHYLRNCSVNMSSFSMEPFDKACIILQEDSTTAAGEQQPAQGPNTAINPGQANNFLA